MEEFSKREVVCGSDPFYTAFTNKSIVKINEEIGITKDGTSLVPLTNEKISLNSLNEDITELIDIVRNALPPIEQEFHGSDDLFFETEYDTATFIEQEVCGISDNDDCIEMDYDKSGLDDIVVKEEPLEITVNGNLLAFSGSDEKGIKIEEILEDDTECQSDLKIKECLSLVNGWKDNEHVEENMILENRANSLFKVEDTSITCNESVLPLDTVENNHNTLKKKRRRPPRLTMKKKCRKADIKKKTAETKVEKKTTVAKDLKKSKKTKAGKTSRNIKVLKGTRKTKNVKKKTKAKALKGTTKTKAEKKARNKKVEKKLGKVKVETKTSKRKTKKKVAKTKVEERMRKIDGKRLIKKKVKKKASKRYLKFRLSSATQESEPVESGLFGTYIVNEDDPNFAEWIKVFSSEDVEELFLEENNNDIETISVNSGDESDYSVHSVFDELVRLNIYKEKEEWPRIRVRKDLMPVTPGQEPKLTGITVGGACKKYSSCVIDRSEFSKNHGDKNLKMMFKKQNFGLDLHRIRRAISNMHNNSTIEEVSEFLTNSLETLTGALDRYVKRKGKRVDHAKSEVRAARDMDLAVKLKEIRRKKIAEMIKRIAPVKRKNWCKNCLQEAKFYCCWGVYYCSVQCQEKDFGTHYRYCTQLDMRVNDPKMKTNPLVAARLRVKSKERRLFITKTKRSKHSIKSKRPKDKASTVKLKGKPLLRGVARPRSKMNLIQVKTSNFKQRAHEPLRSIHSSIHKRLTTKASDSKREDGLMTPELPQSEAPLNKVQESKLKNKFLRLNENASDIADLPKGKCAVFKTAPSNKRPIMMPANDEHSLSSDGVYTKEITKVPQSDIKIKKELEEEAFMDVSTLDKVNDVVPKKELEDDMASSVTDVYPTRLRPFTRSCARIKIDGRLEENEPLHSVNTAAKRTRRYWTRSCVTNRIIKYEEEEEEEQEDSYSGGRQNKYSPSTCNKIKKFEPIIKCEVEDIEDFVPDLETTEQDYSNEEPETYSDSVGLKISEVRCLTAAEQDYSNEEPETYSDSVGLKISEVRCLTAAEYLTLFKPNTENYVQNNVMQTSEGTDPQLIVPNRGDGQYGRMETADSEGYGLKISEVRSLSVSQETCKHTPKIQQSVQQPSVLNQSVKAQARLNVRRLVLHQGVLLPSFSSANTTLNKVHVQTSGETVTKSYSGDASSQVILTEQQNKAKMGIPQMSGKGEHSHFNDDTKDWFNNYVRPPCLLRNFNINPLKKNSQSQRKNKRQIQSLTLNPEQTPKRGRPRKSNTKKKAFSTGKSNQTTVPLHSTKMLYTKDAHNLIPNLMKVDPIIAPKRNRNSNIPENLGNLSGTPESQDFAAISTIASNPGPSGLNNQKRLTANTVLSNPGPSGQGPLSSSTLLSSNPGTSKSLKRSPKYILPKKMESQIKTGSSGLNRLVIPKSVQNLNINKAVDTNIQVFKTPYSESTNIPVQSRLIVDKDSKYMLAVPSGSAGTTSKPAYVIADWPARPSFNMDQKS